MLILPWKWAETREKEPYIGQAKAQISLRFAQFEQSANQSVGSEGIKVDTDSDESDKVVRMRRLIHGRSANYACYACV